MVVTRLREREREREREEKRRACMLRRSKGVQGKL